MKAQSSIRGITFAVTVTVSLLPGYTAQDADIDPTEVRKHEFSITANSKARAEELALDQFHNSVAIGVLDYVMINTSAARA